MLKNSRCVVGTPSRLASEAAPPRLAGFGPGAVVRQRGLAIPAADSGYLAGIWIGGGIAAAGYLPGLGGAFRRGPLAGSTIQAGPFQAGAVTKNTVQKSTDQHTTNEMTRLIPASRGEVGPHRVREPGPA